MLSDVVSLRDDDLQFVKSVDYDLNVIVDHLVVLQGHVTQQLVAHGFGSLTELRISPNFQNSGPEESDCFLSLQLVILDDMIQKFESKPD